MIMIQYTKDGNYRPVVACDVCSHIISNANWAAAVSLSGPWHGRDPGLLQVLHVHKGLCQREAEHRLVGMGGSDNTGWEELATHVVQLLAGVGIKDLVIKDPEVKQPPG